jgi:hypothetical protein
MLSLVRCGRVSSAIRQPLGSFPVVFKLSAREYSNGPEEKPSKIEKGGIKSALQDLHKAVMELDPNTMDREDLAKRITAINGALKNTQNEADKLISVTTKFTPIVTKIMFINALSTLGKNDKPKHIGIPLKQAAKYIGHNFRRYKDIGLGNKREIKWFARNVLEPTFPAAFAES